MSRWGKRHAPDCECMQSFTCRQCIDQLGPTRAACGRCDDTGRVGRVYGRGSLCECRRNHPDYKNHPQFQTGSR